MIEFIPNGADINVPDDYAIRMFFSKKTRMLRTKFFVIRSLLTLLEEKTLSPDLLHPSGQFHLTVSQLVKPFKYLTKLSLSYILTYMLSHKSFK